MMNTLIFEYESPIALEGPISQAIKHEIQRIQLAIKFSSRTLRQFEQKYSMDSATFFTKMEHGELNDTEDFVLWAGEYELLVRAKQKLRGLEGIKICSSLTLRTTHPLPPLSCGERGKEHTRRRSRVFPLSFPKRGGRGELACVT